MIYLKFRILVFSGKIGLIYANASLHAENFWKHIHTALQNIFLYKFFYSQVFVENSKNIVATYVIEIILHWQIRIFSRNASLFLIRTFFGEQILHQILCSNFILNWKVREIAHNSDLTHKLLKSVDKSESYVSSWNFNQKKLILDVTHNY